MKKAQLIDRYAFFPFEQIDDYLRLPPKEIALRNSETVARATAKPTGTQTIVFVFANVINEPTRSHISLTTAERTVLMPVVVPDSMLSPFPRV